MLLAITRKKQKYNNVFFVKAFYCFLFFAVLAKSQTPGYQQLLPIDESDKSQSFAAFKGKLIQTCSTKDSVALYSILFSDIVSSFSAQGSGLVAFKNEWKPFEANSEFWPTLESLLKRGCTSETEHNKQLFICPYSFSRFPNNITTGNHILLYGKNVPVFKKPDTLSTVISKVDYAILEVRASKPKGWVKVTGFGLPDTGYTFSKNIYFPGDPRVIFENRNGKWGISTFIAGD